MVTQGSTRDACISSVTPIGNVGSIMPGYRCIHPEPDRKSPRRATGPFHLMLTRMLRQRSLVNFVWRTPDADAMFNLGLCHKTEQGRKGCCHSFQSLNALPRQVDATAQSQPLQFVTTPVARRIDVRCRWSWFYCSAATGCRATQPVPATLTGYWRRDWTTRQR
jgi:hypothetical protein